MSPSAPDPAFPPVSSPLQGGGPAILRLAQIGVTLQQQFLAKEEIIRLLLISVLAGEHLLLIGPPGTAKSALVRTLARLLDARYFEYLLTRFSEPNELLGPVDIRAFREGRYQRRTERMLPEAEIVFLDEIFKANSAILNSLLTLLNERRVHIGAERLAVPLMALFAASNEVPTDDGLTALLDRFLLRVRSHNLDSFHFHRLVAVGLSHERRLLLADALDAADAASPPTALVSAAELSELRRELVTRLHFSEDFLASYKALIVQLRGEGVSVSDRRVVKLLKLCAASAMLDGREQADEGDLFVLGHSWNSPEQSEILDGIVGPVVQRFFRDHPERLQRSPGSAGLPDILAELAQVRARLQAAASLSDVQLFSQLRTLGELRAALSNLPSDATRRVLQEIDGLLDSVFTSGRLG